MTLSRKPFSFKRKSLSKKFFGGALKGTDPKTASAAANAAKTTKAAGKPAVAFGSSANNTAMILIEQAKAKVANAKATKLAAEKDAAAAAAAKVAAEDAKAKGAGGADVEVVKLTKNLEDAETAVATATAAFSAAELELKKFETSETPLDVLATATSTVLLTSESTRSSDRSGSSDNDNGENSGTIEKVLLNNWKDLYTIVDDLSSKPANWSTHKSKIIMYAQQIGALALTNSMGSNEEEDE
jgi:hypothetical protein